MASPEVEAIMMFGVVQEECRIQVLLMEEEELKPK
jgi:hypothetical protein